MKKDFDLVLGSTTANAFESTKNFAQKVLEESSTNNLVFSTKENLNKPSGTVTAELCSTNLSGMSVNSDPIASTVMERFMIVRLEKR